MSITAERWAWEVEGLRSSHKLILLYIASCSNEGRARVSAGNVCRWTGVDKKTVPVALKELEARELITVCKQPGEKPLISLRMEAAPL